MNPDGSDLRVLVIDDDPQVLEITSEILKRHGYDIFLAADGQAGMAMFEKVRPTIVLQHHERLDGSGYPMGLFGRQLTMESKILSVSDVVEAMSSHRPYRAALSMNETKAEITHGRGRLYDADCVDACLQMIEENNDDVDRLCRRLADEFD